MDPKQAWQAFKRYWAQAGPFLRRRAREIVDAEGVDSAEAQKRAEAEAQEGFPKLYQEATQYLTRADKAIAEAEAEVERVSGLPVKTQTGYVVRGAGLSPSEARERLQATPEGQRLLADEATARQIHKRWHNARKLAEGEKAKAEATPQPTAKEAKRKRPRRSAAEPKPLTDRQNEAYAAVSECHGNFAEAARRLQRSPQTVRQHYRAAMRKLGQRQENELRKLRSKPGTQALPRTK